MLKFRNKDVDVNGVNEIINLSKKIMNLFYIVMIISIVFLVSVLLKQWGIIGFILTLFKIIAPLFIGFVIAWLFNPIVKKLESKKIPRIAGSLIVYVIFLVILVVFIKVLIPTVYVQLNDLIGNLPEIFNEIKHTVNNFFENLNGNMNGVDINYIKDNIFTNLEGWFSDFTTALPKFLINLVTSFFSKLITICFGLVIGLYMLFDFDSITKHFINLVPQRGKSDAGKLIEDISTEVRKCVNGTLTVATMVFVGDSIGFAIVGLQAPLLFGLLCGITDLIPYVGPYIGGAAAVIIGFSQSTFIGVITLIIVLIVQLLENFVLQPLVMSKTMKLHPVTIIIGLLIFEHFFGIIGMILATPTIALLKVIYGFVKEKIEIKNKEEIIVD